MITHSFIFLDMINAKTEKSIWKQGIRSWDDFISRKKIKGISAIRKIYYDRQILEAKRNLYNSDSGYFYERIPLSETWRLYEFFRENAVFLDIETSGVTKHDDVVVVGLFDGLNTKTMIKGINLNLFGLKQELSKYCLIVTFNGATFDIPFLKKRYPGLIPKIPIFDVRTTCARVGLNGGLKEIEKKLGIRRNKIIEKFYGGDPLCLWKMYRATGDEYYLNLLIEYNEGDTMNLQRIADYTVQKLKSILYD
jgi:uncharacterized protein YprB with RNaseH-like and TPR domain